MKQANVRKHFVEIFWSEVVIRFGGDVKAPNLGFMGLFFQSVLQLVYRVFKCGQVRLVVCLLTVLCCNVLFRLYRLYRVCCVHVVYSIEV